MRSFANGSDVLVRRVSDVAAADGADTGTVLGSYWGSRVFVVLLANGSVEEVAGSRLSTLCAAPVPPRRPPWQQITRSGHVRESTGSR